MCRFKAHVFIIIRFTVVVTYHDRVHHVARCNHGYTYTVAWSCWQEWRCVSCEDRADIVALQCSAATCNDLRDSLQHTHTAIYYVHVHPHIHIQNDVMEPPQKEYGDVMEPPQKEYRDVMEPLEKEYCDVMKPPQKEYCDVMEPPQKEYCDVMEPPQKVYCDVM